MYDQRKAKVHISPIIPQARFQRRAHRMLEGNWTEKLQCFRCRRVLQFDQFAPLRDYNTEIGILYLHPYCRLCREGLKSQWAKHPLVTPKLQLFVHRSMIGLRKGADNRGLIFGITEDDVIGQFVGQNGKCALTGVGLELTRASNVDLARRSLSVDRVDPSGHYTVDNIQLTCRIVNIMRMDMSIAEFGTWCARVMQHAFEQRDRESEVAPG
jgi:hypothetical protein